MFYAGEKRLCKGNFVIITLVILILNKQAGCYTPESSVEHPEPVENLAEEFARAGADITQTFTYYNLDIGTPEGCNLTVGIIFLKLFE